MYWTITTSTSVSATFNSDPYITVFHGPWPLWVEAFAHECASLNDHSILSKYQSYA